uniref:ARAD1D49170p n=1 Tax=Blastobotrys adeninivorans TaxID=409370 RepID=A0A060TE54_BLAAD
MLHRSRAHGDCVTSAGKHHQKPRKMAEDIARRVDEWPYKRSVEEIVWPTQPVPAMRLLGKPVDAFRCDLDCAYICRSQRLMKMHWRNVHDYKVWGRVGGLTAAQLAENRKKWGPFKHVKAQRFFNRHSKYFEVYEEQPIEINELRRRVAEAFETMMRESEEDDRRSRMTLPPVTHNEEPPSPSEAQRPLEVIDSLARKGLEDERRVRQTEQHVRPPETEDDRTTFNYLFMTDIMRDQLERWCWECPVCVLAGRDQRHCPTTAACPLARRLDIEYVEWVSKAAQSTRPGMYCKFCRMPWEACLAQVTGERCDQRSWLHMLRILAGLVRAKGQILSRYVMRKSNFLGTGWLLLPMEAYGRDVYPIALEIRALGMDVEVQEEAAWDFQYKEILGDSRDPVAQRLMQCLRIGLSQRCVCGIHRLSECVTNMKDTAEKIQWLSRKLRFSAKGTCQTSGMPKKVCGCDTECKYDRCSGLDALYFLLLQDEREETRWKERWKKDEDSIVEELGKSVDVGGQQYSRLVVEIANLYGANLDGTDPREK